MNCDKDMKFVYKKEYQEVEGFEIDARLTMTNLSLAMDSIQNPSKSVFVDCACQDPRLSEQDADMFKDAGVEVILKGRAKSDLDLYYHNSVAVHGTPFELWWTLSKQDEKMLDFEDSYIGAYASKEEFLSGMQDNLKEVIPDEAKHYFDYSLFLKDMEAKHYFVPYVGQTYVFEKH